MEAEWTLEEIRWMKRALKVFESKPESIRLYTTEGQIIVCKVGINSGDLSMEIGPLGTIHPTAMVTDLHDDMGYGTA